MSEVEPPRVRWRRSVSHRIRLAVDVLPPRGGDRIRVLARTGRSVVAAAEPPKPHARPVERTYPPRPVVRTTRRARANILMYHRIAEDPGDPYSLCVAPERLAGQLQVLVSRAEVVSLDEIVKPGRRPTVAVTFDDGYADNLLEAVPIVERLGVPITVFVTSRMVGSSSGFWWDRLARAVLRPSRRELVVRLPSGPEPVVTGTDPAARAALAELRRRLLPLPVPQIDVLVSQLCDEVASGPETVPRVLSKEELCALAAHPLVTIGAHTTDHVMLRPQPPESQLDSVADSKADLESLLAAEVRHFAYPFGDRPSFDRRSMDAVRRAGFATACSALPGCVTRWSDPLCLPRRTVSDWAPATFGAQLDTWGIL